MRIGILTHPLETNYGGVLQAYALQKVLRDMGHDVLTIDRHNKNEYPSFARHVLSYGKRLILRSLCKEDTSVCWNPFISTDDFKYISRNIQAFIDKHIHLTRFVYSSELAAIDKEYVFDAYVVGSDQVWLPSYCPNSFLDFVERKDVLKLFYAASCGARSFADDENVKKECIRLVKDFKAVSVREEKLKHLSSNILGVNAEWVLDPTMLLEKQDYFSLSGTCYSGSKYLFTYILDKNNYKFDLATSLAQEKELSIRHGNVDTYYVKKRGLDIDRCVFPSIESWLDGYFHSDFVVTDSFHGTVFSILFNKQFVVIGNPQRGMDRFKSLLGLFGLENRLITSKSEALSISCEMIDFTDVNCQLMKLREKSKIFLCSNLSRK